MTSLMTLMMSLMMLIVTSLWRHDIYDVALTSKMMLSRHHDVHVGALYDAQDVIDANWLLISRGGSPNPGMQECKLCKPIAREIGYAMHINKMQCAMAKIEQSQKTKSHNCCCRPNLCKMGAIWGKQKVSPFRDVRTSLIITNSQFRLY